MMKTCYIIKEHRAIADLVDYEGKGLILTRINAPVKSRGQGVARELLARVLRDADNTRTTLFLEIAPSDGLKFHELRAWYLRHDFTKVGNLYVRPSQPVLAAVS